MAGIRTEHSLLWQFMRVVLFVAVAGGVGFLYLRQKVQGRELKGDLRRLRSERTRLVKQINRLDARIERLRSPGRIIPLAKKRLKMHSPR